MQTKEEEIIIYNSAAYNVLSQDNRKVIFLP